MNEQEYKEAIATYDHHIKYWQNVVANKDTIECLRVKAQATIISLETDKANLIKNYNRINN